MVRPLHPSNPLPPNIFARLQDALERVVPCVVVLK